MYSRKVEHVYQLVLRTIDFLTQQKQQKNANGNKNKNADDDDDDITDREVGLEAAVRWEIDVLIYAMKT